MQLPTQLSRHKKNVHKNDFGHVLILAGSNHMLGAAALCSLSAMRAGAGLVTLAIPKSLNNTIQKKISNVIMTMPLPETQRHSFSYSALSKIKKLYNKYSVIAIGPGMSLNKNTQKLILKVIETATIPLVIDADALNILSKDINILNHSSAEKILTPHSGEMSKLVNMKTTEIEKNREKVSKKFVKKYNCTLLLKGNRTIVAKKGKKIYINKTGNPGMATAGSGDVLTGIIAAFIAQGINCFDSAKYGAFLHGKAGDYAAKYKTLTSTIASDIIEYIPKALKNCKKK